MLTPEEQTSIAAEEERKRIDAEVVRAEVRAALGVGTSPTPDQELQREKWLLDIRDLKRPWWQKSLIHRRLGASFPRVPHRLHRLSDWVIQCAE